MQSTGLYFRFSFALNRRTLNQPAVKPSQVYLKELLRSWRGVLPIRLFAVRLEKLQRRVEKR